MKRSRLRFQSTFYATFWVQIYGHLLLIVMVSFVGRENNLFQNCLTKSSNRVFNWKTIQVPIVQTQEPLRGNEKERRKKIL